MACYIVVFFSEESGPKLHCGIVVHYCCTCRLYMLTYITCCRCLRQLTWWSGRLILHFTVLLAELWTQQIISASVSATWRQHCLWSVLYVICVHEGHLSHNNSWPSTKSSQGSKLIYIKEPRLWAYQNHNAWVVHNKISLLSLLLQRIKFPTVLA